MLYHSLNSLRTLRNSYSLKFLSVAFLGIHLPVIGLIVTLQLSDLQSQPWTIIGIVIGVTLVSSIITLYILKQLTTPIREVANDVKIYQDKGVLPTWKITGNDEVAKLRTYVESALYNLEDQRIKQEDLTLLLTHDLRSPIGTAIGALDLLEELDAEERAKHVKTLKEFLTNQLSFIDVMLQIQKYENVSTHQSLQPVEIQPLVTEVLSQLKRKIDAKGLQVDLHYKTAVPLLGSHVMVKQALLNLLTNAIKFSHNEGKVTIEIAENDADHISISIRDEGLGMTKEKLDEIFGRTLKEQVTGTNGEVSTGLGLYLTKTLITKQSGKLTAHSEGPNKGSTFTLILRKALIS